MTYLPTVNINISRVIITVSEYQKINKKNRYFGKAHIILSDIIK